MNKAHVFQHNTTGLQIFVYHQPSVSLAQCELYGMVANSSDWIYLGQKTAQDA